MTDDVTTIGVDADVRDVMRLLRDAPGRTLAVCEHGRLIGALTARIVSEQVHPGRVTSIRDLLPEDTSYCYEDTSVTEADVLMAENGLERIVVLNRGGRVVGVLAREDLDHRRAG